MEKIIQLRSVPHTGTKFLKNLLNNAELSYKHFHYGKHNLSESGFILVPIRNPIKQVETFLKRGTNKNFNLWELNQNG